MSFKGFSEKATAFLVENKERNNREWYASHKSEYKKLVYEPFCALIDDLRPYISEIDREISTEPKYCISRVFRDLRFSKDKSSLYRDNIWYIFRRRNVDDKTDVPGFYFELSPHAYYCGMGMWCASSAMMAAYRRFILEKPSEFSAAVGKLKHFSLATDKYKKKFKDDCAAELEEWYMSKNIHVSFSGNDMERVYSGGIVNDIIEAYKESAALYKLLIGLNDIPVTDNSENTIPENKNKFEW